MHFKNYFPSNIITLPDCLQQISILVKCNSKTIRFFSGVYFSKLIFRTQVPIYESTPPLFFLSYIGNLGYVSPSLLAVAWNTVTGCTQPNDAAVGGGASQETKFCGLFSYTQFCHGEFLCIECLDDKWRNMNARSSENSSFSYHFLFPMPLHFKVFEVHVSVQHKSHCI